MNGERKFIFLRSNFHRCSQMSEQEVCIEVTDTYGGEANYSWVNRSTIWMRENASDLAIIRKVKKVLGLSGHRCRVTSFGDEFHIDPQGQCIRIFVTFP